jgi:hypothetical protein
MPFAARSREHHSESIRRCAKAIREGKKQDGLFASSRHNTGMPVRVGGFLYYAWAGPPTRTDIAARNRGQSMVS